MTSADASLWFSDLPAPFAGPEPFYYDTADFPWAAQIEAQWQVIRDELAENLDLDRSILAPYMDATMMSRPGRWKTLGLMFWTRRSTENCRRFPRTWALLSDVPGLAAVSFNLLEPNSTIKPHVGNTNAIIRCHLGLVIPAAAPACAFRVGPETRSWEEGRLLMFCDAHQHTAWNNTDKERYIMVIDVMRPEFSAHRLAASARVLAGIHFENALRERPLMRRVFAGRRGQRLGFSLFRAYFSYKLRRDSVLAKFEQREFIR